MKCGHWLVFSDNYFDKMMLSIRKTATQWETYISLILRDPMILFYINSLIASAGMNSTLLVYKSYNSLELGKSFWFLRGVAELSAYQYKTQVFTACSGKGPLCLEFFFHEKPETWDSSCVPGKHKYLSKVYIFKKKELTNCHKDN